METVDPATRSTCSAGSMRRTSNAPSAARAPAAEATASNSEMIHARFTTRAHCRAFVPGLGVTNDKLLPPATGNRLRQPANEDVAPVSMRGKTEAVSFGDGSRRDVVRIDCSFQRGE